MAIYTLREDGNFRQAKEVTQMFATFHYHIRGAILYEGILRCDNDFKGDLYQYVVWAFPRQSTPHAKLF